MNIIQICSILLLVAALIVVVISAIESKRLVVTRYDIDNKKIPGEFDGFKIVHLTDLHNASFGIHNEELISKVAEISPDIIVFTGDAIIGKPGKAVEFAAKTINELSKIATVYFSLGNHELRTMLYHDTYGDMYERFIDLLDKDIVVLHDDTFEIKKNDSVIKLFGVSLNSYLYKRLKSIHMEPDYLEKIFGKADNSIYNIFLAHNPDYFPEYAEYGADLVFAGHVHGGMVRLPFLGGAASPKVRLFPKYDRGLFEETGSSMILSGGLGNHTIKLRVNNLPEIIEVTLKSSY